jgi:serine/threonine-protein kinase
MMRFTVEGKSTDLHGWLPGDTNTGASLDLADTPVPGGHGPELADTSSPSRLHAFSGVAADTEPIPGYRLVARLGGGGSGEVWKALGPGGFPVAMKFIALKDTCEIIDSGSPDASELGSVSLMREVRHAHLLAFFGVWQLRDLVVVGMELADRTLWDRYQELVSQGLPGIPFPELIEYSWQAAQAIDYLNEPRHALVGRTGVAILHRDIKPQNLVLVGDSVKLGDFGLASALEGETGARDGLTPAYAAPEIFEGELSARADQYSFAVTYCQLRGGRLPFTGNRWELILKHCLDEPDLTMLLERERPLVARALAKTPETRWPNCRAFVNALRETAALQDLCGDKSASRVTALTVFHEQLGQTSVEVTRLDGVSVDELFAGA